MKQQLTALCSPCLLLANEPLETKFETAVTEAIDDSLSALGATNKQTIYRHLENRYGIKKQEIPFKIADFANAIEETFGSVAKVIEVKIIEKLHAKNKAFHYVTKKDELNFTEFISCFQRFLEPKAWKRFFDKMPTAKRLKLPSHGWLNASQIFIRLSAMSRVNLETGY